MQYIGHIMEIKLFRNHSSFFAVQQKKDSQIGLDDRIFIFDELFL